MHLRHLGLLAALLAASTFAQDRSPPLPADATLLQVSAHGEVRHAPDVATIGAGVTTQDADAAMAMRDNAARMDKVIAALRQAGIAASEIQTAGIGLQAQYAWGDKQPPKITGYQASNTVNVRLHDMAKIGKVLAALVAAGANQIDGPNFAVDKPDAALDEARRAALAQARARAELYAQAAGLRVRRIVSISESGQSLPSPRPMMRMAAGAAAAMAAPPIEAGENALGIDLNVQFELGR